MTQPGPSERPKADWRLIGGTLVTSVFACALALALDFSVDTGGRGKNGLGAALGALVTGADSPEAHIVSMPLLWVARLLAIAAVLSLVLVIVSTIKRNRRRMLEHRAQAE